MSAHNVWSGGASVAVTLVGWAALAKGLTLLLVPGVRVVAVYKGAGFERYFHVWLGVVFLLGLWMTAAAFSR